MSSAGRNTEEQSSASNYTECRVTHVDIAWNVVDFGRSCLRGTVTLKVSVVTASAKHVILDTKELTIFGCRVNGVHVEHHFGSAADKQFGKPLIVPFAEALDRGTEVLVEVDYSTTKDGMALQWLTPDQTAGSYLIWVGERR